MGGDWVSSILVERGLEIVMKSRDRQIKLYSLHTWSMRLIQSLLQWLLRHSKLIYTWDKVYVREKSTSGDKYIWFSYKAKKKRKKELCDFGPVRPMGNVGEKYLHIPVVTWCNIQVDSKCPVTNLGWWYWHREYVVNSVLRAIKKSCYRLYSCGHHIFSRIL